ncbi:DUF6507 family protein [Curtobacterium sp. Leaf261]|uniref:DUF6507 family protein n=1 Tax=Curtobacterium sp. Leaf261 TaxID=1736311 RepID=UPI000700B26F|nr:DUF6507 family protein [Curtobacterium sp. Leaf261]KQO63057.1 hypothetical protein ASF23_09295 [Curtobacterium sp. Leaf261]
MGAMWSIDVVAVEDVVRRTASAGGDLQDAAVEVDLALTEVQDAVGQTTCAGAARSFVAARRDVAMAAAGRVSEALLATSVAMQAFITADEAMADTASERSSAVRRG